MARRSAKTDGHGNFSQTTFV